MLSEMSSWTIFTLYCPCKYPENTIRSKYDQVLWTIFIETADLKLSKLKLIINCFHIKCSV